MDHIQLEKPESAISLYIHWPFCLSKCPYCNFNSHIAGQVDHDLWLESYKKELDYFQDHIKDKYIGSIFFGGGTPSLMRPATVSGIIDKISNITIIDKNTEITLETNPTSFEINKFKAFKAEGINRISIGIQSLIDKDLKKLGRGHSALEAIGALKQARDIFSNISFDLIYARENQTLKTWQNELEQAIKLAGGHISLYQLTIEKGTHFYDLFRKKELIMPQQDLAADMYEWTLSYLTKSGYDRYEISNYAQKNYESRHNLTYWRYNSYLGIGPGAHSRLHGNDKIQAITMWHKPQKWLQSINETGNAIQNSINLTNQQIIHEIFVMGLRLKIGVDNSRLQKLTGYNIKDVINQNIAMEYVKHGLIELRTDNIRLTDKGLILHNYIVSRLLK